MAFIVATVVTRDDYRRQIESIFAAHLSSYLAKAKIDETRVRDEGGEARSASSRE